MSERWHNWARTEYSAPTVSIAPRNLRQITRAIERARETGHAVKPIGASHSFSGIGATDGIRIDLSRLRGLQSFDRERSQVTLWGGTHLWELPAMLESLGLALPNLGDVDRQTIAGATQTGTHGTGIGLGGISTGIVGATIITGTGEVLTVNNETHPELMPAIALGLGALGVLVSVTLQCVPRFQLRAVEAPERLNAVLEDFTHRQQATDHFEFFWFPHSAVVRTKSNTRMPFDAPVEPLSRFSRFVDEEIVNNALFGAYAGLGSVLPAVTPAMNGVLASVSSRRTYSDESHRIFVTKRRVRFHEMEYGFPVEKVPDILRELRTVIERRGHRTSFPVEVRSAAGDNLLMSTAHARDTGYIAVHRHWRDRDRDYFRDAEAIFVAHGGRPHWGKMHSQHAGYLSNQFPEFDRFLRIRDQLDPDRVFANPYLERVLGR